MYAVKKQYAGAIVCINDADLIKQGLKNSINLDLASQTELKYLYEKGHASVEKIEKAKGVK